MVHLIPTVGFTGAILGSFGTLGSTRLVPLGILSGTLGGVYLASFVPLVMVILRGTLGSILGSLATLGYTQWYPWQYIWQPSYPWVQSWVHSVVPLAGFTSYLLVHSEVQPVEPVTSQPLRGKLFYF